MPRPGPTSSPTAASHAPRDTRVAVTDLLVAWGDGDRAALDALVPIVYAELHRIAARQMAREAGGHTLQPTALVNEVYLRLATLSRFRWKSRAQFFAVSARLMRWVLVDHARARSAEKRGGGVARVTIGTTGPALEGLPADTPDADGIDVTALDDAMSRLAELHARQARVVELRVFGGLTLEEVAEVLDVALATVKRDQRMALAWLRRELSPEHAP